MAIMAWHGMTNALQRDACTVFMITGGDLVKRAGFSHHQLHIGFHTGDHWLAHHQYIALA